MTILKEIFSTKCFGGMQKIFSHQSKELKCEMKFSAFIPSHLPEEKLPVLFYLSGLTCSEKNFIEKSGFQKHAAQHGIIVIGPDTSPRGCNIEGEADRWDFGVGAGFYIDATVEKWKENYRMYSYINEELPNLINSEFPTNGRMSIFGHSMGGHGALISALKNPGKYRSVSAFSPICNPTECNWGRYCFNGYLGEDKSTWINYDATHLVKIYAGPKMSVLIDQGTDDEFLVDQLLPDNLETAAKNTKVSIKLRMQQGYNHSYYFISTFIGDHFEHHASHLKN